jgi:hypothetical protein
VTVDSSQITAITDATPNAGGQFEMEDTEGAEYSIMADESTPTNISVASMPTGQPVNGA